MYKITYLGTNKAFTVLFLYITLLLLLLSVPARAQELGLLEEEEAFYNNFALTSYSKEFVQEHLEEFYDLFGKHITEGFFIYSLANDRSFVSNQEIADSTIRAGSNEHRAELFFENFRNICYSRDAIGGVKTAFILGDQIRTRFTPLTFNKRNYEGIRWDIWYEGLGITSLMSRTRPGLMAREYDWTHDMTQRITDSWVTYPMIGAQESKEGSDWNTSKTSTVDWTARTTYGDYDFLWAFRFDKKFNENLRLGASYVNHHHSDVKKGEKWHGDLPDALAPAEIHFELYDLTFSILDDPGVVLYDLTMTITTEAREYPPYRPAGVAGGVYYGDHLYIHAHPGGFPYTKSGNEPLICTFYPHDITGRDSSRITDIKFNFDISGNYLVFVSTDRISVCDEFFTHWDNITAQVKHRQIREIASPGDTIGDSISVYSPYSELYYGDYILKSPQITNDPDGNRLPDFTYHYQIPTARVVYGLDFDGKAFETDIKGEVALNNKRAKYPTVNAPVENTYNLAGYLNLERPLLPKLNISGDFYTMAADYQPYLSTYQVSRYLAWRDFTEEQGGPIYNSRFGHPIVLGNGYTTIDDNEDDDYYVENNRRLYPSDAPTNSSGSFYHDGTRARNVWQIYLPSADSSYSIIYEDIDGVIPDRYDRNRNSILDYVEDFLLYEADPPLFDLEPDDNNNGIADGQEDDIYPDYPYTASYIYTSNGVKSLGIRGMKLAATYAPLMDLSIKTGINYEQVLDPDIDGESEPLDGLEGRALQVYARGLYRLAKREAGLTVFLGQELKYVRDGIRNDAAIGRSIDVDFLRFRNALVSNSAASVNYLQIPNFEVTAKVALSAERHLEDKQELYLSRRFYLPGIGMENEFDMYDYKPTTILGANFIAKAGYKIQFPQVSGYLSPLKKLKIMPQYKLHYSVGKSDDLDPRDIYDYNDLAVLDRTDSLRRAALRDWVLYRDYNSHFVLSVPILRASYPLGEKTSLEFGWQWMRNYNLVIEPSSYRQQTRILQVLCEDNYLSFNIAFQIGWQYYTRAYDFGYYDRVYRYGNTYRRLKGSGVFFRIYAGI